MKKIIFFFLTIIMQQFYIQSQSSQLDPLQNYVQGQGCPTILLTCATPPLLPAVGSFGEIFNNAIVELQIVKTGKSGKIIPKTPPSFNFYEKSKIFFPDLTDDKNKEKITLESVQRKNAPGKITFELNNAANLITISSFADPNDPKLTSIPTQQLDLSSLYQRTANFLTELDSRAGIMWPDPDLMKDSQYVDYYDKVIKKIKDTTDICNLHVARWTVDFTVDSVFNVNIIKLDLLFKYPVLSRPPTAEEIKQGTFHFDPSKACDFKTFKYTLYQQQLLDEGILSPVYYVEKTDDSTQKTNGDSGQSTTTTN